MKQDNFKPKKAAFNGKYWFTVDEDDTSYDHLTPTADTFRNLYGAQADEVVERNRDLLLKRSQVGLSKYGCGLDNSGLGLKQFLIHALEETLDKANYLQAAIMEIEKQEKANEQI